MKRLPGDRRILGNLDRDAERREAAGPASIAKA
jgi:hypothetical protein